MAKNRVVVIKFKNEIVDMFGPMSFEDCVICAQAFRAQEFGDKPLPEQYSVEYATIRKW